MPGGRRRPSPAAARVDADTLTGDHHADRQLSRPVRDSRSPGSRRHGRGVSGQGHEARPRRCDQGPPGGCIARPRAAGSIPARGEGGGRPRPSERRRPAQRRGARRPALHHHAAGRGADAVRDHSGSRPAFRRALRPRHSADRRDCRGPRAGHHAPGSQAVERDGRSRRPRPRSRLRTGEAAERGGRGRRRRGAFASPDPGGSRARDRGLHVARAGGGKAGRSPGRHLRARHPAVRDGHRPPTVRRRYASRDHRLDSARPAHLDQ